MVERLVRNEEVRGSTPLGSTNLSEEVGTSREIRRSGRRPHALLHGMVHGGAHQRLPTWWADYETATLAFGVDPDLGDVATEMAGRGLPQLPH